MKLVSLKSNAAALTALVGSVLLAGTAAASPAEDLLKKHACVACHAIDSQLVGPAYKKVAEKYRGDAKAEAMLVQKVLNGGAGTWGQIPMPPHKGRVPDAEVQTMIKFILALK
ncbi:c-type cytochrome [Permianibacter sp. IMCC34836]|uniref:c-type cytochrome n=1 Tax=Permianibacter fluminis TaxID=2738515 RepID=UPI0015527DFA|nr:c-type cytochrome [Permianibacter fluminis]NQD36281.1 c-type cytochrome [Permianibacter fluminis]